MEIARLVDFFSHPIRFLLRERLGIHLGAGEAELADQKPFRIGRQEAFRLAERLLPLCLAGAGDAGIEAIALAGRQLPRAQDDLPEGFETTAHALLDPLFAHLRETPAFDAAEGP